MGKIDFVVDWVDGNDPEWRKERQQYMPQKIDSGNSEVRFRDWNLMRYWFRGIEKFAPWVNNVYFVTWGHYPEWLNLEHPKLKIIKHTDYIPREYLPTYNCNVIELNLHRIPELSEQFVLFNDDTFLTASTCESDFFIEGSPCDTVRLGQTFGTSVEDVFPYMIFNNIAIINKYFSKKEVQKKYWRKFLSLLYGKEIIRTILLWPFGHFGGFLDTHLPTSHLKSSFFEVWEQEPEYLHNCGKNKFRKKTEVTQWLVKNWRYCKGQFVPRSIRWGKSFSIGEDERMIPAIKSQKYKAVCVNDCDPNLDFEKCQKELIEAFEAILPEKCSFEN